ncbi:MAG: hypothetical protein KTR35_24410 [Gammaproteobacteria bacterium]|nr:hypothetical protein [Gammaproteobacteria bacterium]
MLVTSCGGGGGNLGALDDDAGGSGGSSDSGGSGGCTYVLSEDISSPTTLVNTASYCDYELDGWVEVRSVLNIEPGVVVQAKADARIVVDGGEVQADGTAQNRIVFEGLSHVSGYWRGIDIIGGRASVFDHVDVKDAGQVCHISFCPDAGFIIDDISISITNTTVSNSYVHGMSIFDDVNLTAFSNNRFFGNVWAGLVIEAELVPILDSDSDYLGVGDENGQPFVRISSGRQERGEVFRWKSLNAPYFIGSYFYVEGGILYLEPGVEIVFGEDAWLNVEGNGVIQSMGTEGSPNLFRGLVEQPGYWDGIELYDSPWPENTFSYTTISHTGSLENLSSTYAALRLEESQVTLIRSRFVDNDQWGIWCNEDRHPYEPSIIYDGLGNQFVRNRAGDYSANCRIR